MKCAHELHSANIVASQQNGQRERKKETSLDALLKRSNLCILFMTQIVQLL